jgi:hypothetical protein
MQQQQHQQGALALAAQGKRLSITLDGERPQNRKLDPRHDSRPTLPRSPSSRQASRRRGRRSP